MSSSPAPKHSRVASVLSQQRETVDRVFSEIEARLVEEIDRARRESTEALNQAIHRLSHAEAREDWVAALVDCARPFAGRVAVFGVSGDNLKGLAARGLAIEAKEFPVGPAFAGAIASREPVAALRTAGELSGPLAALLDPEAAPKCHLFPIVAQERVAAVLYAEGDPIDANGLEAMAALAGASLRPVPPPARPAVPDWSQLPPEEQALHLRAQRFARVRVAEMRLYQPRAVRSGRAQKNLYEVLKAEIDSAREAFRRDFISASPVLPDYLHLELIRTLANDDLAVLGEDYPGPLF